MGLYKFYTLGEALFATETWQPGVEVPREGDGRQTLS
jgi:hypothetical protein